MDAANESKDLRAQVAHLEDLLSRAPTNDFAIRLYRAAEALSDAAHKLPRGHRSVFVDQLHTLDLLITEGESVLLPDCPPLLEQVESVEVSDMDSTSDVLPVTMSTPKSKNS